MIILGLVVLVVVIYGFTVGWGNLFQNQNGTIKLAGINLNRRGETLSIEDFAILSNYIHSCDD